MSTLIIYGTKHGCAESCARAISGNLTGKADLYNSKEGKIPELSQYDKVIIGGSIYAGRIQKEVSDFCTKNMNALKDKKLGLYICCMVEKSAEAQLNSSFPKELLEVALAKDSFGGEFKFSDMSFVEKTITKMVNKMLAKNDPGTAPVDMSKDTSTVSEDRIKKFSMIMNNV